MCERARELPARHVRAMFVTRCVLERMVCLRGVRHRRAVCLATSAAVSYVGDLAAM